MKEILKKTLVSLLIIITMFNFIYSSNVAYASDDSWSTEEIINTISNSMGGIVAIVFWPLRIKIIAYSFIITEFVTTTLATVDAVDGAESILFVTPYHVFFNKLNLLSVDFFDFENAGDTTLKFRTSVSNWYYNMRMIALAAMIVVLVYVGIMMAVSTMAEDKSKYKKMLVDWVMSIALLFLMQYIIIFIIELNATIVRTLDTVVKDIDGLDSFMLELAKNGLIGVSINSIVSTLVYAGISIFTLGFVISYINRMLKVGFLIIISPLITITYSIDKMKDNKSQALDTWLKEIIYTVLIQPFHCIIYISYISICFELLITPSEEATGLAKLIGGNPSEYNQLVNGVLAILCIAFIRQGEKIVRKIFGFKDDDEKTSFAAGLATTSLVMSKAKNAGATARNIKSSLSNMAVVSKIKDGTNKFIENRPKLKEKKEKILNSNGYTAMKANLNAINSNIQKGLEPLKKSINGVKKFVGAPKRFVSNLDQKLTNYAVNHASTNRFKAKMARGMQNALSGIRKGNSSAAAAALIMGTGEFVSKDGGLGKALQANAATYDAVNAYHQGSTNVANENLGSVPEVQKDKAGMDMSKDPEIGRLDAEYKEARQDTKRLKADAKLKPNDANAQKAYMAAKRREREVGDKYLQAKKDFKKKRIGEVSRRYDRILSDGSKGKYKSGSEEEKKLQDMARDAIKGTIQSDVKSGAMTQAQADKAEAEALAKLDDLMYSIQQNAGLTNRWSDTEIEKMIQSGLDGTLSQIPSFGAQATSMLGELEKRVKAYSGHCNDAYTYDQLSKFKSSGGDIDLLTETMYDEVNT